MASCAGCSSLVKQNQDDSLSCTKCKNIYDALSVLVQFCAPDVLDYLVKSKITWSCSTCQTNPIGKTVASRPATPSIIDSSTTSDLKLIIKQLGDLQKEQSKLIDTINGQGDKLDSFELKFTEIFSQLSLIKNENLTLRNDFLNLTKRFKSLESNYCQNSTFNNDAPSDLIDQQARSKNVKIFNAPVPAGNAADNSNIATVSSILGKRRADVGPVSISRLDKSTEETQNIPKNCILSASDIELKNGDTVFCCYFKNFKKMYICKACRNNTMPVNMNLIVEYSKSKDIVIKNKPRYMDIVMVKFEKYLFRAKVHDKSGLLYTVELLDIGKYLKVLAESIYELPNDWQKIPELVKRVGLKGTNEIKVNGMVEDYFSGLWYNEPVPLILNFKNNLDSVSLKRKNSGCNIIDDLLKICNTVNERPAKTAKIVQQNPKYIATNDIISQIVSGDRVEFLNGTSIEHINVKHIKLYNAFNHVFEQLKNEKSENLKPISPNTNDIVLASSSILNGFLRAEVIAPVTEDSSKLKCFFIDHGIFENIPLKNIYELPNYMMTNKVPVLANRVALAGLTKNNLNITPFLTSLIGKEYILEFEKNADPWDKQVTLKDPKTNTSLNEELQHILSNNSSLQQRLAKQFVAVRQEIENIFQKQSQPIKSHSSVKIIHFEDSDSIYIRDATIQSIENFNLFNMQMIKYYRIADKSSSTKILNNIEDKNKLVCVRSLINMVMYTRALIIDKIGNQYCVFHVDYGNKEIVEAKDILELSEKFDEGHYQYFAINIKLRNMPRLTSEKECELVKDYFKTKFIICNETVIIEFNECDPNGLNDSILKTEHYEKNIVDEIKTLINP